MEKKFNILDIMTIYIHKSIKVISDVIYLFANNITVVNHAQLIIPN